MQFFQRFSQLFQPFHWKKVLLGAALAIGVMLIAIITIDRTIAWRASAQIITDINDVPAHEVAVVLGTSKYIGKRLNSYYTHRIDAAIELYHQGKVKHFILSGDNAHRSYNEPWTMKRDLLKADIPESAIHLDYAGFRTLDSIVRANKIFATDNFLIITQQFHCERALFIANAYQISAKCLAVAGPSNSKAAWSMAFRETLARVKAVLDLYIINTQPKFLGPQEPIVPDDPNPNDENLPINNDIAPQVTPAEPAKMRFDSPSPSSKG